MNNGSDVQSLDPSAPLRSEPNPVTSNIDPHDIDQTAQFFALLSDPSRLRLLIALQQGETSVGTLAERVGMSESAASHALRLLRTHRVVAVRRSGRMAFYRLDDEHIHELIVQGLSHAQHINPAQASAALVPPSTKDL